VIAFLLAFTQFYTKLYMIDLMTNLIC